PLPELTVVKALVEPGLSLEIGGRYMQRTPQEVRRRTAANHSATHLLHWALRKVLGNHVKQAGSLVNDELLRFDFTHFKAMTPEEVDEVEKLINDHIAAGHPVGTEVM